MRNQVKLKTDQGMDGPTVHTSSMPGLPTPSRITEQRSDMEADLVSASKVNVDKSYTPSSLPKTGKREPDELLVIEEEGEEEVSSPFKGIHGMNEKSPDQEEEAKFK